MPATKTAISVNGSLQYQWKAQLELLPGTQYCYCVSPGSSPVTEIDLLGRLFTSFWTQMPMGATQSFSFAVFGRLGLRQFLGANPYQANVITDCLDGARFAVTTGDNGYPAAARRIMATYSRPVMLQRDLRAVLLDGTGPLYADLLSLGNHGLSSSDTNHPALITWPQDRAVSVSGGRYTKDVYCCLNGTTSASYPSAWYAFDAGPARFYILNTAWTDSNVGTATEYKNDYDYHWRARHCSSSGCRRIWQPIPRC